MLLICFSFSMFISSKFKCIVCCVTFAGLLGAFAFLILLLVVLVIIWRPKNAGIYPMKHWKPKYRNLGAPPPLPNYILYDDDHYHHEDFSGPKAIASTSSNHGTMAGMQ